VKHIVQGGRTLDVAFLDQIKNGGKGIILVEAWSQITHPLKLQVTKQSNGEKVAEVSLPLSINSVESMYRHYNVLFADDVSGGRRTELNEPPNYPDQLCTDKKIVFVHGYNVNPEQARGWNAKMFKSMWWTGSHAKFYGVTWHGSETQLPVGSRTVTPNYHLNVDNAFAAARPFAGFVNSLGGGVTVVAHSLGNMVVASAIHDWTAQVDNFYMIDAAVAIEAFDGGAAQEPLMAHEDWYQTERSAEQNYPERVWASEWYLNSALSTDDVRRTLTWRNRLSGVTSANVYNFFSSGEEVLAVPEPITPTNVGYVGGQIFNAVFGDSPCGERSWVLQEKLKGRTISGEILGSNYGGWGFNPNWYVPSEEGALRRRTPDEAAFLTNEQLIPDPFFVPGPPSLHDGGGSDYALSHRNTLLAEMIPARTRPAGANRIASRAFVPPDGADRNLNLTSSDFENGWPQERLSNEQKLNRWLHSDIEEVAYPFTWKLFSYFNGLAHLNE
jgi:pimeloyl-ACP methyl ester carboxylesterase